MHLYRNHLGHYHVGEVREEAVGEGLVVVREVEGRVEGRGQVGVRWALNGVGRELVGGGEEVEEVGVC